VSDLPSCGAASEPLADELHYVRALLDYDPCTGIFRWAVTRTGKASAGRVAGKVNSHGYRQISIRGRLYAAHRLAFVWMTGVWPTAQVDHRDGQRDHNAWHNLRLASAVENGQNRKAQVNSRSGHVGVSYIASRRRYLAQIQHGGRRRTLGWFRTAEEAAAAYRAAKEVVHSFHPVPRA
jgi:hypothetical protein